jgi:hypothetical protein
MMVYGETVTQQIENIRVVEEPGEIPQLSFVKRALFRTLPFLDRTVEKMDVAKYDYGVGDFRSYTRVVKKSGRVIDRAIASIYIPTAEYISPIVLPDFSSPEEEKVWKEEFMKQCEIPPVPMLANSETEKN